MKDTDFRQIKSQLKLQKAYLSLTQQGFEQLSIQQICKEAKVTRPTFYKQYEDIQQLRLDLHHTLIEKLQLSLKITDPKPLDQTTANEMTANVIQFFEHIQSNSTAYRTLLIERPDALFSNEVKKVIQLFIEEGTSHSQLQTKLKDINFDFLLSFYAGAYIESTIWWITNDYPITAQEMAKLVVETAFSGSFKVPIIFDSNS